MNADELGAVVIGRNEGERLVACLASVREQITNVVYADSGSVDGSPRKAEPFVLSVVRLDPSRPFTAARGRNEGLAALKRLRPEVRFVQFIDGDCELALSWVNVGVAFFEAHPKVAVVCGRRREARPDVSLYNRLCDLEWDTPLGEAPSCGGDSLVRTEAFEAVGGFEPRLISHEEPELCMRLRRSGWK